MFDSAELSSAGGLALQSVPGGHGLLAQAIELLEKANARLEPELLTAEAAHKLLAAYARAERLSGYGVAALSRKIDDTATIARAAGTSMGKAKSIVATGKVMRESTPLTKALSKGQISLDQAATIAPAEQASPGAAAGLISLARKESFHVLSDEARKTKLEAEQQRGLAERQRSARRGRNYVDELGMININLALEPHIGAPIMARAEAEATRLAKAVRRQRNNGPGSATAGDGAEHDDELEPFAAYLADAYAAMLSSPGSVKARTTRPELVMVVSHEVVKRGWKDVRPGEMCKIPGVGPVAPEIAKEIAADAFLSGVFYDGKDLRHLKRWSRSRPPEVDIALELGPAPEFDGVRCIDCGNRFHTEFDHVRPRAARGPTSHRNLKPRCWPCHQEKTKRDRMAGLLRPAEP